jgi:hypothetical protein
MKEIAYKHPTAETGIGVKVLSDPSNRIGPVLSLVEKVQGYLSNS